MARDFTYIDHERYTHRVFKFGSYCPVSLVCNIKVPEGAWGKKRKRGVLQTQPRYVLATVPRWRH
jgi:hypothetical protein